MLQRDGGAVLDASVTSHVPKTAAGRKSPGGLRPDARPDARPDPRQDLRREPTRDLGEDFAPRRTGVRAAAALLPDEEEEHYVPRRRFGGLRFRLRSGVPQSMLGRVVGGAALLAALGGFTATLWAARTMLLHNSRLVIESSSAIQITGNSHLTRPQLLSVFGEDVDRNILTVPLAERRAELERLPWVEHATVMRLLPNHFRVAITERTPVAFVRQGSRIGLVDASGVLLDMDSDGDAAGGSGAESRYSFPVVTGLGADDPLSTRAARMKLYSRFTRDLDDGTDKVSKRLSEVDLSNPEDVKALIPDGPTDILVHFGDKDFLHRYELYQKNLPGWKKEYPRLASADMRYERQVVLEMQPGAAVPVSAAEASATDAKEPAVSAKAPAVKAKIKGASTPPQPIKPTPIKPAAATHLQNAFDVKAKTGDTAGRTSTTQVGPP